MDDEVLLTCDEDGHFSGEYVAKEPAHTGEGHRHLAIAVLLYNRRGQVLLQRRKHRLFDGVWDVTGATHPLHRSDGTDETIEEATARCLEREYGTSVSRLQVIDAFSYFARYGQFCENEHCTIIIAEHNGEIRLNPKVGYECKWISKNDLLRDVRMYPERFSPWATEAVECLQDKGFFE